MITYTKGNLLEAEAEALVNTVNTVGVMGKGIALMFKESYPQNFAEYSQACKAGAVATGRVFVTEPGGLYGPRWIVNFPTKRHWRQPAEMQWIIDGLRDLARFIGDNQVKSIAIPPLGSGNGGLDWREVKPRIEDALGGLRDTRVIVYEPTAEYQNIAKRGGVEKLTPARALIAEMVRRYSILGFECSILEIQKLAWFLERFIGKSGAQNPLRLQFQADRYGPFAPRLNHLINALDGAYLRCAKRIPDAGPLDVIRFVDAKKARVRACLQSGEASPFLPALEATTELIDGFESPFGLELLATVDWLIHKENARPDVGDVKRKLKSWPGGADAGLRKLRIFDDRALNIALERLQGT